MKADLDQLMQALNLDAIVVLGDETPNTEMAYLTNGAHAHGQIFKKRGEPAVFVVNPMELDEAAKSGLIVKSWFDFNYAALREQYKDDVTALKRERDATVLRTLDITGRVGFYGAMSVNAAMRTAFNLADSALPLEVVVDHDSGQLFGQLYETKDEQELAALRTAAHGTSAVVQATWDFIASHYARDLAIGSAIVDADDQPLTIGAVKRFIRMQLAEHDLDDSDGCIFAQGRDAAMPHSKGKKEDVLQVGRSIVFDIFPKNHEDGYFHDMTRTWCIGLVPPEIQAAYDDVLHVFHAAQAAVKIGEPTSTLQLLALDYFESKGHPTHRSAPATQDGYTHSIGHGVGLNIHEAPSMGQYAANTFKHGSVFTIEPGLYYTQRGFGIRVEDTVYIDQAGNLQTLTDFRYDLLLPIRVQGL